MSGATHNLVADDLSVGAGWTDRLSGSLNLFGSPNIQNI
jgi:hypothetical protein